MPAAPTPVELDLVERMEALNRQCRCMTVDRERLGAWIDRQQPRLFEAMAVDQPHLFSNYAAFVPRAHIDTMTAIIDAVAEVVRLPSYRQRVLSWAPLLAHRDPGPSGALFGYDFHLGKTGPQLIEINTNAGGAMVNLALAHAQQACCAAVGQFVAGATAIDDLEAAWVAMFRRQWQAQRSDEPLSRIAIVDENPQTQFLYPEFLLFQDLLERAGVATVILDPRELRWVDGRLVDDAGEVDLVYNRLTDFYFDRYPMLAQAYAHGRTVFTPHPHAHAIYANKRNLTILSDPDQLAELGASAQAIATLSAGVPPTLVVTPEASERLWAERKGYFFKPMGGYGSKAAYRGAKLTRKMWELITAGDYVAQALVPPSERTLDIDGREVALKLDVRCYVDRTHVQLVAARLYQGQTTNFRTQGGGFAPVFTEVGTARGPCCA